MPAPTRIFHVGSLGIIDGADAENWEIFFADCQQRGLMTSLDPNVRPGLISDPDDYVARIKRMMRHVDIFKLSDEDLEWLYPDRQLETALADCRADCDAVLFILTLGGAGSRAFLGGMEIQADATAVEHLVDTVGAGDTFMASILSWVIENDLASRDALASINEDSLRAAIRRGSEAAAINCGRSGCNPPWRDELASV
jgi:fructokinase